MTKKESLWISMPFIIIIFGFFILNIVIRDKEISVAENRTLTQMPKLQEDNFRENFENYYIDQFAFRDEFLKLYTKSQVLLKKNKVRDYYVCDDNWILENPDIYIAEDEINLSADIINDYSKAMKEKGKEVYYISTPHKTNVLNYMYPRYVNSGAPKEYTNILLEKLNSDYVNILDLTDKFLSNYNNEQLENLYFKTDHHWNSLGAFEGLSFIAEFINEVSGTNIQIDRDSYDRILLEKSNFIGSYNLNIYGIIPKNEIVPYVYKIDSENYNFEKSYDGQTFWPVENTEIVGRFVNDEEVSYGKVYNFDDQYYRIKNENALIDKSVLIIRDSYHSAMSWLLADIFSEVEVMDPRHIGQFSIKPIEVIQRSNADVIMFMYNDLSCAKIIPELYK